MTASLASGKQWRTMAFKAMGGPCEIRAWSATVLPLHAVITEVRRLEQKYSRYLCDSVTSRINASAGCGRFDVDEETALLLAYASNAWTASDGLFDLTSGVLRRVWDFKAKRIPSAAEIDAVLPLVGWEKTSFDGESLDLPAGMEIDFGGIVKEYAADRAAAVLREHDVQHALVELSGDIAAPGPLPDGSPWLVRIRNPRGTGDAGVLELAQGAVATSGDYERCILVGGRRYSHILDPRTGWPAQGLASVTVCHEACTVAGSLSTIAMLKGSAGPAWLDAQGVQHVCIRA